VTYVVKIEFTANLRTDTFKELKIKHYEFDVLYYVTISI